MTRRQWLLLATIVVIATIMLVDVARTDPSALVRVGVGYVVALVVMLGLFISPMSTGFDHIRITREGLALWTFGLFRLPVRELGDFCVVPEEEVSQLGPWDGYRGARFSFGRGTYPLKEKAGPAVFIEQRRPGKRPLAWMVATRNPDAVIEALRQLRQQQGHASD